MNSNVTILDCTLRDGGYYNNWNFSEAFVSNYIQVMAGTRANVLEVGYRHTDDCNALEYEAYLKSVVGNTSLNGTTIAVMVDAKKFFEHGLPIDSLLDNLFLSATESAIGMIRVAVHYKHLNKTASLVSKLCQRGYRVALNLMQIDAATVAELSEVIENLLLFKDIEVIYIADSLGSMSATRVTSLLHLLMEATRKPVGFHAHDNKGLALLNSQAAAAAGATYIDATLMGMGRGAGNTRTEQLLPLLGAKPEELLAVQRFIVSDMSALYKEYLWGGDAMYQFAADNEMHPMYVQEVKRRLDKTPEFGFKVLEKLSQHACFQYNKNTVDDVFSGFEMAVLK